MDESVLKKLSSMKVSIVPLNSPTDFGAWHIALRRLVKGYGMGDALLFSVPEDRIKALKIRTEELDKIEAVKKEEEKKSVPALGEEGVYNPRTTLTGEKNLVAAEDVVELKRDVAAPLPFLGALGVTKSMDDFFSATTIFVNVRTNQKDDKSESYYRQEIWCWMEASLEKGTFKWVARNVNPTYDIHALYTKICSLANRATWISYALEFRKIFTMAPGTDIFQYHADLVQQIKLVASQGESLGLQVSVTPAMEQCLLLIAAWQIPQYKTIALDFTMDDKAVTVETLVKELERQRLLTSHLNLSQGPVFQRQNRQVDVRLSSTSTKEAGVCYAFQKGSCTRQDCPFLHERVPIGKKPVMIKPAKKPPPRGEPKKKFEKKSDRTCYRCGSDKHLAPDCTFNGTCDYCKKEGHKQSTCHKKKLDATAQATQAVASDGIVSVRMSRTRTSEWGMDEEPAAERSVSPIARVTIVEREEITTSFWDAVPEPESALPIMDVDLRTNVAQDTEITDVEDEVMPTIARMLRMPIMEDSQQSQLPTQRSEEFEDKKSENDLDEEEDRFIRRVDKLEVRRLRKSSASANTTKSVMRLKVLLPVGGSAACWSCVSSIQR